MINNVFVVRLTLFFFVKVEKNALKKGNKTPRCGTPSTQDFFIFGGLPTRTSSNPDLNKRGARRHERCWDNCQLCRAEELSD